MKKLAILFIKLRYSMQYKYGILLPGLGKIQRLIKENYVFSAFGKYFYYLHTIEGSYDYLLIGKSNEPETHLFFNKIFPNLKTANFVDVGASIGEFVFSVSNYKNVQNIHAFEPRPDCSYVLKKMKELNNENRISIHENIVSDSNESIFIYLNPGGTSSSIYSANNVTDKIEVKSVFLDNVLPKKLENCIILIDVEGAEPLVLNSGKEFIKNNLPLIIFEYNLTSKKYFDLDKIQNIIGTSYIIHRIKADGTLDQDFSNSWNCVAVPKNTEFAKILLK